MTVPLTRANIRGVWAAIPTPFDANGDFDAEVFKSNVIRLADAGVHGIYTTGSDGEFYSVELAEFREMARAFQEAIAGRSTGTAMGVTWTSTRGTIDRLQIAAEHGIQAAHVGHPLYMEMTHEELIGFWDDVSASVPDDFGLIHYNQPRLPNLLDGKSYQPLVLRFDKLIGTKFAVDDTSLFVESVHLNPALPHFCGETDMTPMMMLGARGICSWFTNVNPRYMVDWYDDCVAGRWEEANARQLRMLEFSRFKKEVCGSGARAAVVNKAVLAAIGFLEGTQTVRRPYLSVPDEAIQDLRRRAREEFADLLLPSTLSD